MKAHLIDTSILELLTSYFLVCSVGFHDKWRNHYFWNKIVLTGVVKFDFLKLNIYIKFDFFCLGNPPVLLQQNVK